MNPSQLLVLVGLLGASALLLASTALIQACGVASRRIPVSIADESAIIIWDEASKTEHFIRRATFVTQAEDFGFLVPTPTQPELGEADEEAFKRLERQISILRTPPAAGKGGKGGGGGAKPPPVEVLDEKRVAGQHVVVLKATDADALGKWLKDHDYEFSPGLKKWIQPYIDAKWIITASKVAKDRDGVAAKNVALAAVRMSFKTVKPFFPYSEPASENPAAQQARLLRIFFIGTGKSEADQGRERGRPAMARQHCVVRQTL